MFIDSGCARGLCLKEAYWSTSHTTADSNGKGKVVTATVPSPSVS
jgi:hypothetical protein